MTADPVDDTLHLAYPQRDSRGSRETVCQTGSYLAVEHGVASPGYDGLLAALEHADPGRSLLCQRCFPSWIIGSYRRRWNVRHADPDTIPTRSSPFGLHRCRCA
ncbi:hypothetical protein [Amycolatopsis anabasis]|uniref:hypothetical protein n=1 Tax=Amycolatopsis anabasis TaxID=1840409 RepID=UPI00131A7D12|nr:hypothetical protein [Amycolatopsis anabasis]